MQPKEIDLGPGLFLSIDTQHAVLVDERDARRGLIVVGGVCLASRACVVWFNGNGCENDDVTKFIEKDFDSALRRLEALGKLYLRVPKLAVLTSDARSQHDTAVVGGE